MLREQVDEVDKGAYTHSGWPTPDGLDQAYSMILNSPTHDLATPFHFTFDDSEVRHFFLCSCHP